MPRASTSPALVETDTGRRWVMKFTGAGPGPFGILTEFIALRIAAAFGAPVPEVRPLHLSADFPWMVGTDEFDGMLQRSPGWNLGVAFVEDARPAGVGDLVPSPALAAIATVDRLLQNMDRTSANPNLLVADDGIVAIDYDACLYLSRALGPLRPPATELPAGHILAPLGLSLVAAPPLSMEAIVADAPDAWIAATGQSRDRVSAALDVFYSAWISAVA